MLSKLPLLWRTFVVNATLFVIATLLLAFTPVTLRAHITLAEGLILLVGLTVMLITNLLVLRPVFAPLEQLAGRMQKVDLLRPGQRLPVTGGGEVSALVLAFNEMLDRLEAERRESSSRALQAQEAERSRISRGLHDEVGQVLTGVLLQFDAVLGAIPLERRGELEGTRQTIREALEDVRRIAQDLRPAALEHLGLVSALTDLSTRFAQQSGLKLDHYFAPELPRLSPDAEITIYRVAQEGLTNIGRHAHATRIGLSLESGAGSVVLRLTDDGIGFSEETTRQDAGGLRGMRERAVLVGGVIAIKAGPRGGSEIRLEVPASGLRE